MADSTSDLQLALNHLPSRNLLTHCCPLLLLALALQPVQPHCDLSFWQPALTSSKHHRPARSAFPSQLGPCQGACNASLLCYQFRLVLTAQINFGLKQTSCDLHCFAFHLHNIHLMSKILTFTHSFASNSRPPKAVVCSPVLSPSAPSACTDHSWRNTCWPRQGVGRQEGGASLFPPQCSWDPALGIPAWLLGLVLTDTSPTVPNAHLVKNMNE